jgi:hypothetical protein
VRYRNNNKSKANVITKNGNEKQRTLEFFLFFFSVNVSIIVKVIYFFMKEKSEAAVGGPSKSNVQT